MKKYKQEIKNLSNKALRYINIEIIIFIVLYLVSIIFLSELLRIIAVAIITLFAVTDLIHDIKYYKILKKHNDDLLEGIENWYPKKTKKFIDDVLLKNHAYAESSAKTPNKGIITIFMHRYAIKQNNLFRKISSQKPTE